MYVPAARNLCALHGHPVRSGRLDRMPLRDRLRQSPLYRLYVALKYRLRSDTREELFTGFYKGNLWGDSESRSGAGSSLAQTERLRAELVPLLRDLGVTSLLDAPCGDFAWMQHVDLGDITYIGGDIVSDIVTALQREHGCPGREFRRVDLVSDDLPKVDAVMVRDLLLHLPNKLVAQATGNVRRSGATWLLASHYPGSTSNPDIQMGQNRSPNMTLAPFGWPQPLRVIEEKPATAEDRPDKQLAVWRLADLPA